MADYTTINWRTAGRVPYTVWRDTITAAGGPAELASREAWEAAGDHSALALAMLRAESSYATDFNANGPENRNPLNLRPPTGGGYMRYASWTEGVKAWRERITDPTYKAGIYARTVTLSDLVNVYAPSFDNNNPQAYVGIITTLFARWGITPTDQPTTTPQPGGSTVPETPIGCWWPGTGQT